MLQMLLGPSYITGGVADDRPRLGESFGPDRRLDARSDAPCVAYMDVREPRPTKFLELRSLFT